MVRRNSNEQLYPGYASNFIKILVIGFLITISFFVFRSCQLSKAYPELSNEDYLNDTVIQIIRDGRRGMRVTFKSGLRYSLPWAQNFNYSEFSDISDLVVEGDFISKNKFSDTLRITHSGRDYIFVAKKSIDEE